MAERLIATLISAAILLISAGVNLVEGGNYAWGSVLVALGIACVAIAVIYSECLYSGSILWRWVYIP